MRESSEPDVYFSKIVVVNSGNTRLAGNLQVPDETWLAGNVTFNPRVRYVRATQVSMAGHFELGPGQRTDIPIEMTFPETPVKERAWELPLRADVNRPDLDFKYFSIPIQQFSRHDVTGPGANDPESARPDPWLDGRVEIRRLRLMAAMVAVIVAIAGAAYLGRITGPGYGEQDLPTVQVAADQASPSSSPSASPTRLNLDFYEVMPCTPGTYVAFLSSTNGPDADMQTARTLDLEIRRERFVLRALPIPIHASRWDDACPRARSYVGPKGDSSWRLVWAGPAISAEEAENFCVLLQKPNDWDCLTMPVV
jgi:hypothetical protein